MKKKWNKTFLKILKKIKKYSELDKQGCQLRNK